MSREVERAMVRILRRGGMAAVRVLKEECPNLDLSVESNRREVERAILDNVFFVESSGRESRDVRKVI